MKNPSTWGNSGYPIEESSDEELREQLAKAAELASNLVAVEQAAFETIQQNITFMRALRLGGFFDEEKVN